MDLDDIQMLQPGYFHLLWIVAAAVALFCAAYVWRRLAMRRFATEGLWVELFDSQNHARRIGKRLLLFTALVLIVFSLVDIRWGKQEREMPQRGIDVVFAVDVSRSMLAQDAKPSRLERVKQQIQDMLSAMQGDRVALVAYAGEAEQKVPLTNNYSDFQQALRELTPYSVRTGGSQLSNAITVSAESFLDKTPDHKAIVVFSDGDEQAEDADLQQLAESLFKNKGIRIFTIGLGDSRQGARIPIRQPDGRARYVEYQGTQVWSKLQDSRLKVVADASQGTYIPAETKRVDMGKVYRRFIASIEQREYARQTVSSYFPRFQWFAWPATICLIISLCMADSTNNKRSEQV